MRVSRTNVEILIPGNRRNGKAIGRFGTPLILNLSGVLLADMAPVTID